MKELHLIPDYINNSKWSKKTIYKKINDEVLSTVKVSGKRYIIVDEVNGHNCLEECLKQKMETKKIQVELEGTFAKVEQLNITLRNELASIKDNLVISEKKNDTLSSEMVYSKRKAEKYEDIIYIILRIAILCIFIFGIYMFFIDS
ncbi:MAG: hypothetical protein DRG78_05145 [Epsilonproteobacteria bacterium]|nr:MAG: hypothetical protein DRG78_05145 [Campylobacterota bacterium]